MDCPCTPPVVRLVEPVQTAAGAPPWLSTRNLLCAIAETRASRAMITPAGKPAAAMAARLASRGPLAVVLKSTTSFTSTPRTAAATRASSTGG